MNYSENFEKVNNAENIDDFEKSNYHESANFVFKFIFECIKCHKEFFFNNKFHKHFRQCNKKTKSQKLVAAHVITHVLVVKSINKLENYQKFAFRIHRYTIARDSLIL